jgi:hypothetical protein
MVLKVFAHAGQAVNHIKAERAQMSGRTNARHLKYMRRADGPRREDDLATGINDMFASAPDVFHADGFAAIEENPQDMGFSYQRCIASP